MTPPKSSAQVVIPVRARGGSKKGERRGGRKKGVPNKATAAKAAAIAASGQTPLDFMLSLMRDPGEPKDIRLDAAKSAAPYVHPKLAAIEHTGPNGAPLIPEISTESPDAIARRLLFLLEKGASAAK